MAENVGGIVWTASIETQQLVNGERQINQSTNRAGRNFDNMERKATGLNTTLTRLAKTIVGVFAVRQIQRFAMETIRAVDEQNKFAQSISVSYQELQKLQFAAEQNGATINEFNNSLRRLARRTEEAARGTGAAVQAFENLGLNARELESLSPDEIFLRVADSFQQLEGSGKEVSTAFGLFDTEGAKLINTLRQGSAGIRELGDEAERSGRIISQQTAEDAAKFNDELNKLQGAAKGAAVSLGAELVPAMTDLMSATTDWLSTGNNAENLIKGIGIAAQATAVVLAGRFVGALVLSINSMNGATFAARSLSGSLALLGGPAGLLTITAGAFLLMSANAKRAQAAFDDKEQYVRTLTNEYKNLNEEQRESIRINALEAKASAEAAKARLEAENPADRARQSRRMAGGDRRGVSPSQDQARAERDLTIEIEKQERAIEIAQRTLDALNESKRESQEQSELLNRNTEEYTEATGEAEKSITSLAERNEELRAVLSETSDELEVRRALQEAGVEAGTAEAEVIEALVRGNQGLAEAIREAAEAEQRRQELEGVAASDLGLTRLQALKQRYDEEAQLLLAAQEAGIESEVSYQERLNEIYRQYSEERKQIVADETETWQSRLEEVGFSMESMMNQGVGALASVAAGFQSGSDAARAFAQNVLTQALGALIRMALQSTILKSKEVAEATASGAAIATAYTPAAIAANIASFGGAGVAAAASAPIAATATTAAIQMGGARQYGGPTSEGKAYRVNETEPEMFMAGGHQYLMPNMRGEVMNSKQVGGGDVNVSIRVNNNAPGVDVGVRQQGSGNDRQFILDVVKADISGYGQSTVGALTTVTNIKRKTQ